MIGSGSGAEIPAPRNVQVSEHPLACMTTKFRVNDSYHDKLATQEGGLACLESILVYFTNTTAILPVNDTLLCYISITVPQS